MTIDPRDSQRRILIVPQDFMEDAPCFLTFIHAHEYTDSFQRIGLTDEEQIRIETGIMINPTQAAVIQGTGGIREFACAIPIDGPGALHLSVFYCYLPELEKVILIDVFDSSDIEDMTTEECNALKQIFEQIQQFGPESWDG